MSLLIATPAYAGMVHVDYIHSLLQFRKENISFDLWSVGNESLITRARNRAMSYFYENREKYTHLLYLDADIRLSAEGLRELLSYGKDVIGAAVPLKGSTPDGSANLNIGRELKLISGNLHTTERLGTAVMILSRKAVEALVDKAINEERIYYYGAESDPRELKMYDIFRVGVVGDEYFSEDRWVCEELKALGFELHISNSVITTHHCMHAFRPKVEAV